MILNKIVQKLIVLLLVMVIGFAPLSVCAAVNLNIKGSVTISVLDRESKEPIGEAVFQMYHFATVEAVGEGLAYEYTDAFKNNGMNMGDFSDAYLPVHLMAYAKDKALPYTEKASDDTYNVIFDDLPCGAYLIVPVGIKNGYLNPNPFIIYIPIKNENDNTWHYHIDATPKTEIEKDTNEKTYVSVKKQWKNTDEIPESITVSLMKDGTVEDTVLLNEQNNWQYKWNNLDKNHSWFVAEINVPTKYTVSYAGSEKTIIITNTYEGGKTTVPSDSTTVTTVPSDRTQTTTKPDELIQTGQLNWPIPILLIAGLLFISIGWALLNLSSKDEETV